jgi:hypothetical protein
LQDDIAALCFIDAASYFEAFCKYHAAAVVNIAPSLIENLRQSGHDTRVDAQRALAGRSGQNQKGSRGGGKPRGQCPAWRGRAYPHEDHRKAGDQERFDHGFPRTRPALVPLPSAAPAFASGTISDFPKAVLHPLSLPRRSVVHPIADLAGSIPQTPAVFPAFLVRAPPGSALPAGPALHRNDTLLRRSPAERTGVSL